MTYFQWTTGEIEKSPECSKEIGCTRVNHVPKGIYWAWDRALGAWVHYAK